MTVSTVDQACRPSGRVVLLKAYDENGFVFYTNYDSHKATDLSSNPNICMHFFWPDLERQLIIEGTAAKNSREESEAYFASRPRDSQLGAWASKQSSIVSSRDELEERFADLADKYNGQDIPCPPFWGGFLVTPAKFEFWQGRLSRLHDRICYLREGASWKIVRLSP